MVDRSVVLVDTDVYSNLFAVRGREDLRAQDWRRRLRGLTTTIAAQTRTETLAGALINQWGARRTASLVGQLDETPTFPVDLELADVCAHLTARLRADGHPLHKKIHTGDRWVAATAIHHAIPLLSGDGIYHDVPDLTLLP